MSGITDEIKTRCNIVDVVGRYVQLKRTGTGYMGLCPFHGEKTPSFHVSDSRQFYHCFGCGESGDVISFVMKMDNVDFMTAVRKLCEQYGIDMEAFGFGRESGKNEIYEMNREAARFFFHAIADRPNPGREYLQDRGLDKTAIAKFGLGYADGRWHSLLDHMKAKGYSEKQLMNAGLISQSKGRYYDKFRDRVIFPIINTRGKVIAFGGRAIAGQDPKYLNSPESAAFSKKDNLFGLNLSRDAVKNADQIIIVEGYMDMISLYMAGITNVAATLGTAMTPNHCVMIRRYTTNVVLSYDSDEAGRKAALRGIEVLKDAGLNASVLHVTDGKDPDEFIRSNGPEAFRELVSRAQNYADYRLESEKRKYDLNETDGAVRYIRAAAEILNDISPALADTYVSKLAGEAGISQGAVRKEIEAVSRMRQAGAGGRTRSAERTAAEEPSGAGLNLQRTFLALAVQNPQYIKPISEYESVFTDRNCFRLFSAIRSIFEEDPGTEINKVFDSMDAADAELLARIRETILIQDDPEKLFNDCVTRIRINELQKRHRELEYCLDVIPEGSGDRVRELMDELKHIDGELHSMKQKFRSDY